MSGRSPEVARHLSVRVESPSATPDWPAKALVGDGVPLRALILREGHDVLAARARWRDDRRRRWHTVGMHPAGDDRWAASLRFDRPGLMRVEIDAWTDRLATWRRNVQLWVAAGEDIEAELAIGVELLAARAALIDEPDRSRLLAAADTLADRQLPEERRLAAGLDDAVWAAVAATPDPWDMVTTAPLMVRVERERAAAGAWYELFPRSEGGLQGAAARLDAVAAMGFDVVYLPPVHPIGHTNRKGRRGALVAGPGDPGSPWAIGAAVGGHLAVEPGLGTLEDFDAFVQRAGALGLEVALDLALQCSPDHPWLAEHPEWFATRPDGTIRYAENPPKKYQDIHALDLWCAPPHRAALWEACLEVVLHWAGRGVRVFRVDNPHTKPLAFWSWLLDQVWRREPDVVFLAEAFTRPAMMHELAGIGFSQSYTYFTWRTDAAELAAYVEELCHGPASPWFRPSFWPTTPDILSGPLRYGSRAQFEIRLILAALLSPSYGVYSGYELCEHTPASPDNEEFADSEKYRVVRRDWAAAEAEGASLAPLITDLNRIRRAHPATSRLDHLHLCHADHDDLLAWAWVDPSGATPPLLCVVHTRDDRVAEATVSLPAGLWAPADDSYVVRDLLTGERWSWQGRRNYVRLDPSVRVGHVFELLPAPATA